MTELAKNAHTAFDQLHKLLLIWGGLLLAAFTFSPNIASASFKLPLLDFVMPRPMATLFLGSAVFLVPFAGCSALYKAQSVLRVVDASGNSEARLLIQTYPSIATVNNRSLASFFVATLGLFQAVFAASGLVVPNQPLDSGALVAGLLYAAPIFWLAGLIFWWDRP
jgi:hypothetical protein